MDEIPVHPEMPLPELTSSQYAGVRNQGMLHRPGETPPRESRPDTPSCFPAPTRGESPSPPVMVSGVSTLRTRHNPLAGRITPGPQGKTAFGRLHALDRIFGRTLGLAGSRLVPDSHTDRGAGSRTARSGRTRSAVPSPRRGRPDPLRSARGSSSAFPCMADYPHAEPEKQQRNPKHEKKSSDLMHGCIPESDFLS